MRKSIYSFTLLLLFTTLLPSGQVHAKTRLLVNCFFPPQHFMCREVLNGWKEQVEEATEGRVKIRFPAKSMAPPPAQMESVLSGIFDGALQFHGFIRKQIVGSQVSMMPFTAGAKSEDMSIALWRTYEQHLDDKNEYKGLKLLGLFSSPGAEFFSMTDTPINSIDSVSKRKMWALPGVTSGVLKTLNTPVVSSPAVQMNEIISRGVVDGYVGIAVGDSVAFKVLPYAKSITLTDRKIFAPASSFFLSEEAWNKLPEQDQIAVMRVSGENFARLAGSIYDKYNEDAKAKLTVPVVNADHNFEQELIKASQPFIQQWIEESNERGIDGQAVLDYYLKTLAELEQ